MSHQITIQPSGHTYVAEEGATILEAGLAAGFHLPYGCRNGACGSCKGKLIAGEVDYGKYSESALSEQDKATGLVLFCCARPRTDVVVECREVGALKDIAVKKLPCRVQKIERVADDVIILYLKLPANERMQFLAGQYVDFLLRDGSRRSFSLANAPHDDEFLQLHVRRVAGGQFTEHVFTAMKERDILRFEGPHGTFFLREDSAKPIIFVASGTGFAPIKAMIEAAFKAGITRPMTLYWGGRRPMDLYMADLPQQWTRAHAHFKFIPVISDAPPEDGWQGRTGFVHRAVMEDHPDLSGHQVYACGVPVMVDAAKRDFTGERRLPADEFFADSFTTQADVARSG